jgi:hypothetical protein
MHFHQRNIKIGLGPRPKTGAPKVEKLEGLILIYLLQEVRNKRAKNDKSAKR